MVEPINAGFSPLGDSSRVIDLRNQAPRTRIPKFFEKIPKTVVCNNLTEFVENQQNPKPVEFEDESAISEQLSPKNKEAADIV